MKVSLLNKLVMAFTLKKGIYLPYNFFYTCNTVEVDFLNLGTNGITESVTCGKGKNNRLTVAVPVHSGRRAVISNVDTVERVARPGLRHQRAVRGALPVVQRAVKLPDDQVQVTWGLDDVGAILRRTFEPSDTEREMANLVTEAIMSASSET